MAWNESMHFTSLRENIPGLSREEGPISSVKFGEDTIFPQRLYTG